MLPYRLLQAQTRPEFQDVPEPHAGPGKWWSESLFSAAKKAYDDFEHGRLVDRAVAMPASLSARAADRVAAESSPVALATAGA